MELKCPSCERPLWSSQAASPEQKEPESGTSLPVSGDYKEVRDCPFCATQLPLGLQEQLQSTTTGRWLPTTTAPKPEKSEESPFPSRLAEPLPEPGYPDQLATRDRFTAEIQAKHQELLQGRPTPQLLEGATGPLAPDQQGHRDPLGSDPIAEPSLADKTRAATAFPAPELGSPKKRDDDVRKDQLS